MTLRGALLGASMLVLPMIATMNAHAQAIEGPYVAGGLGFDFLQDENPRFGLPGGVVTKHSHPYLGGTGVLSMGWGFGNGFRAEVEGDFIENGLHNPGGLEKKAGAMANVLYDFVGVVPMVQPYVGVGVGYQWVIDQGLHGAGPGYTYYGPDHNQGDFAYQAILGVSYPIQSMPGLALTAEYRFMGLMGDRSYGVTVTPTAGASSHGAITFRDDYNHSVLIGLRYTFGQAPAPVPAMAPMPVADMGAKTFLVFFDWDRADLTDRASGIVRDAASYSRSNQYTRIDVDGNTDTSGTPTYNQGLSERRARVVAGELVRDGVPQNVISMHAYGDTKLLVPTGPGVREPQNRRVEIVFH
jgi:outer membrane protein OmpA-like peptidoglycan-associated protein